MTDKEFLRLYCIRTIGDCIKGKWYEVEYIRTFNNDFAVTDSQGLVHYFGNIGDPQPYTRWFITEKQQRRNEIIDEICQ